MCETTETTQPESEVDARQKLRERWAPLGLVLAGGFWNFFTSPIIEATDEEGWRAIPSLLLLGWVYIQPILCAVWGAWVSQPWFWRLPTGISACLFLALTIVVDWARIAILSILLAVHLLFVAVLALIRWRFGFTLTTATESGIPRSQASSFGLRYLFLWTTVAALLAGLGRLMSAEAEDWGQTVGELLTNTVGLSLSLAPPAWMFVCLLEPNKLRARNIVAILFSVPIVGLISSLLIRQQMPVPDFWSDIYVPICCICIGALLCVVAVTTLMRQGGYRVCRLQQN